MCTAPATLIVRPLLSGRDYHSTHHENSAFRFDAEQRNNWLVWRPYHDVPSVSVLSNGEYSHEPEWFRNFLYLAEQERGLDFTEDLASPGLLRWDLSREAVLILAAEGYPQVFDNAGKSAEEIAAAVSQIGTGPSAKVSDAAASRRRCLSGSPRLGPNHHRRLSVVYRLGPRHVYFAPRAVPGHRSARRRAQHSPGLGRDGE